jgi:TatD DNase family protein
MNDLPGFTSQNHPTILNPRLLSALPQLKLCDIGFNGTDEVLHGKYNEKQCHRDDYLDILLRANSMGVRSILCTASSTEESRDVMQICRTMRVTSPCRIVGTVGIHPTRCLEFEKDVDSVINKLEELIRDGISDGTVVAIGECGLDYDRLHFCPKDVQLIGFEAQLKMALHYSLPLFLHNRNTGGDFYRVISQYSDKIVGGVVHSFTGTIEEMQELVRLNLFIGINGCSMKTEENLEVIKEIPLNHLLVETDSPWCSIKPTHASYKYVTTTFPTMKKEKYQEGKLVKDRSEPCQLVQILEVIAKLREIDVVDLAEIVSENTKRLFPTIFTPSDASQER